MKTRVPETITCLNCNHNIVIKLYEVDTTVNSSQGHFHTVYNATEPAYTVYCINCGHFMTNDPVHAQPKPDLKAKSIRRTPSKRVAPPPKSSAKPQKKAVSAPAQAKTKKTTGSAANKRAAKKVAAPAAKPRQKAQKTAAKTKPNRAGKASPPKRPQRKKAK